MNYAWAVVALLVSLFAAWLFIICNRMARVWKKYKADHLKV